MSTTYRGNGSQPPNLSPFSIASSTNASPIVITSATAHGLATNDAVHVDQHAVNTNANNVWLVTVIDANHFSLQGSTGNGVGGATGTVTPLVFAGGPIPSDGDADAAASVDVSFQNLYDRTTNLLVSTGQYKLASINYQPININAPSLSTAWTALNPSTSGQFTVGVSGWATADVGSFMNQAGICPFDIVEVEFHGTLVCPAATGMSSAGIVQISLGGVTNPPGGSNFPVKIPGSGQTVALNASAQVIAPVCLKGMFQTGGAGTFQCYIGAQAQMPGLSTLAGFYFIGDVVTAIKVWRATNLPQ